MATYNLGKILPSFLGVWDPTVQYHKLDVVFHNNCSWMSMSDNKNSEPTDSNTANWMCIARGSSFQDWSDTEKQELVRLINVTLQPQITQNINNYIETTLDQDVTIQTWMRLISMPQSQYDAMSDKTGVYFVYPG